MATLTITTPEGLTLRQEIAGGGSRFVAALLDGLLLGTLWLLVLLGALGLAELDPTGLGRFAAGLATGGVILIAVGYQFVFQQLWNGQTPGKRALGLRVKDQYGHPASKFQLLMRSLLWVVDVVAMVPISVGLYLIILTPRHQRLGDLAAGTVVLREPPGENPR
ncbi:MAG: RDD family protein, partial [Planctomycetota bacterium]|nr:RDD family protein [Planctomycetota bacterium]